MFLAGAAYVVNGTNCVEATTGPVLMMRKGLAPEALDSFPTSSSVENIFAFGENPETFSGRGTSRNSVCYGESQDAAHLE